jgi:hypothetical protein
MMHLAGDDVQLPILIVDSLLAVIKLQQQQQQQQQQLASASCWVPIMNSINLHVRPKDQNRIPVLSVIANSPTQMHAPVSTFLRSGRLNACWLPPLSAATAAYLRLSVVTGVGADAALPGAVWDVCKRCVQVGGSAVWRVMCGMQSLNIHPQARPTEALAEVLTPHIFTSRCVQFIALFRFALPPFSTIACFPSWLMAAASPWTAARWACGA